MTYFRPTALSEALSWLADRDASIAAGCTDLFPATTFREISGSVLDVTAIKGLRGITEETNYWRIGGATTWTDIIRADLPTAFDGLKLAAREVGSVQIQNAGTVAGNVCNASPAADGVPCLLTLDALVELTSTRETRCLDLSDFLIGPRQTARLADEILTAILIPKSAVDGLATFRKLGARRYLVISIAMVAARLVVRNDTIEQAAIAVGACGPIARRLTSIEADLTGKSPSLDIANSITDERISTYLNAIDVVRGDAA